MKASAFTLSAAILTVALVREVPVAQEAEVRAPPEWRMVDGRRVRR